MPIPNLRSTTIAKLKQLAQQPHKSGSGRGAVFAPRAPWQHDAGQILIENTSGEDRDRGDVCGLGDWLNPDDTHEIPIFESAEPTEGELVVILLNPIPDGQRGLAVLSGRARTIVTAADEDEAGWTYAKAITGDYTQLAATNSPTQIRILRRETGEDEGQNALVQLSIDHDAGDETGDGGGYPDGTGQCNCDDCVSHTQASLWLDHDGLQLPFLSQYQLLLPKDILHTSLDQWVTVTRTANTATTVTYLSAAVDITCDGEITETRRVRLSGELVSETVAGDLHRYVAGSVSILDPDGYSECNFDFRAKADLWRTLCDQRFQITSANCYQFTDCAICVKPVRGDWGTPDDPSGLTCTLPGRTEPLPRWLKVWIEDDGNGQSTAPIYLPFLATGLSPFGDNAWQPTFENWSNHTIIGATNTGAGSLNPHLYRDAPHTFGLLRFPEYNGRMAQPPSQYCCEAEDTVDDHCPENWSPLQCVLGGGVLAPSVSCAYNVVTEAYRLGFSYISLFKDDLTPINTHVRVSESISYSPIDITIVDELSVTQATINPWDESGTNYCESCPDTSRQVTFRIVESDGPPTDGAADADDDGRPEIWPCVTDSGSGGSTTPPTGCGKVVVVALSGNGDTVYYPGAACDAPSYCCFLFQDEIEALQDAQTADEYTVYEIDAYCRDSADDPDYICDQTTSGTATGSVAIYRSDNDALLWHSCASAPAATGPGYPGNGALGTDNKLYKVNC